MAKILEAKRAADDTLYYELVATSGKDLSSGNWLFKIKPFRHALAPSNAGLAGRWLAIMEENLPLWTQHPLISKMLKFIFSTHEKIVEYILYTGDIDSLPPGAKGFDHPTYGPMIVSNVAKAARYDLMRLEKALKAGEPVSFYHSSAIQRVLEHRADYILAHDKNLREGLYSDVNDLAMDAALSGIAIEGGPISPEEVYRDTQDIKMRYFAHLLDQYEGVTERRREPIMSYGDVIPDERTLASIVATDIGNIRKTLGEDPFFDVPFFMLVKEFRQFITDEFNRRDLQRGLDPSY
jgi:hypothetical protein